MSLLTSSHQPTASATRRDTTRGLSLGLTILLLGAFGGSLGLRNASVGDSFFLFIGASRLSHNRLSNCHRLLHVFTNATGSTQVPFATMTPEHFRTFLLASTAHITGKAGVRRGVGFEAMPFRAAARGSARILISVCLDSAIIRIHFAFPPCYFLLVILSARVSVIRVLRVLMVLVSEN